MDVTNLWSTRALGTQALVTERCRRERIRDRRRRKERRIAGIHRVVALTTQFLDRFQVVQFDVAAPNLDQAKLLHPVGDQADARALDTEKLAQALLGYAQYIFSRDVVKPQQADGQPLFEGMASITGRRPLTLREQKALISEQHGLDCGNVVGDFPQKFDADR